MKLTLLFISGGEIFIILLFILIFFGADKIPEFTRMMGKGVREFRKATDDIKREFSQNSSGVINEIRSIGNDLSDSVTKEISTPIQKTASETAKSFDDHQEQYGSDYYYNNPYNISDYGNEYHNEPETSNIEPETSNIEPETSNIEPETSNIEPETSNIEPQTSNIEPETS